MNLFKLATIVAFTAGFAHTVHAADLGGNFALNTDVKTTYMVDAETTVATINPEFSYTGLQSLELTAGTTLNLWENVGNFFDKFPECLLNLLDVSIVIFYDEHLGVIYSFIYFVNLFIS